MSWDHAAEIAEARLAELAQVTPPRWARAIVRPAFETRDTAVLYAPDWQRTEVWQPLLRTWAVTFAADDDVTLVLAAPHGEHDAVASAVGACIESSGIPSASLPDLLLDEPGPGRLDGLVARCDAVLLDGSQAGPTRELLTRRSLRTLVAEPAALAAFAAHLRSGRSQDERAAAA